MDGVQATLRARLNIFRMIFFDIFSSSFRSTTPTNLIFNLATSSLTLPHLAQSIHHLRGPANIVFSSPHDLESARLASLPGKSPGCLEHLDFSARV